MTTDEQSLLWVGAFRYWCGRMTISVESFTKLLTREWPALPKGARDVILRDLEREVEHDTERRSKQASYLPLGMDCDREAWIEALTIMRQHEGRCRKCGGDVLPGIALAQTVTGSGDFEAGDVVTLSPGGPGKLIDCRKCVKCGWSVTANEKVNGNDRRN